MEPIWVQVTIGAVTFLFTAVTVSATTSWVVRDAIAKSNTSLMTALAEHQKSDDVEFTAVRKEIGEVGHAVRSKIGEVELWSRDHYVRRDSFQLVVTSIENNSKGMRDDLKDALATIMAHVIRIEGKVDRDREFDRSHVENTGRA